MPVRFVRIFLVFAMLFSTVGVSAASFACKQKQKMAAAACAKCKTDSPTKKSCCQKVYKHLGVKSEYQRSATTNVDLTSTMVLAILADAPLFGSASPLISPAASTGPPIALSSPERCSLISSFRI